jgi:hypothetical protein
MTRSAPLLLALTVLASGCAAPAPRPIEIEPYFLESVSPGEVPPPGPLPEEMAVRAAFNRPIMTGCDELSCFYDLARVFRVRALACEPQPPHGKDQARALCRYERQLIPLKGEPGPWHQAETLFWRFTAPKTPAPGWHVERDLTPRGD